MGWARAAVRLGPAQRYGIGSEIVHVGWSVGIPKVELLLLDMRRVVERCLVSTGAGGMLRLMLVLRKDVAEVDGAVVVNSRTVKSPELFVGHERRVPECWT